MELFYHKPYHEFINKLRNREHFKYARYNDGEFLAIIGNSPDGSNCDGHKYFPELSVDLTSAILNYKFSNDYLLELYMPWYDTIPPIKNIVNLLKIRNPELCFCD